MSNFLEYSNKTQSNIIPKEEFMGLVKEVFNVISSNLSKSLGPLGSSATILDGMMTEATKDGYSILNKYRFHNRYKKMIYNLILAPCRKMNNTVGDGTTTAICLTTALFNRYSEMKNVLEDTYRLPRQFNKLWDNCINSIIEQIPSIATPLDTSSYDDVYHIAYVVSNGDEDISKNIASVYQKSGTPSIKQKDSPTNKSYISPIEGFDFPSHLIDEIFIRNEDLSVTEDNPFVIIFDHKIETDFFKEIIIPINEVLRAKNKKLVIIAPAYDIHLCNTVVAPYINIERTKYGSINLILEQFEHAKLAKNQLEDLAVILGCDIINSEVSQSIASLIHTENSIDAIVEKFIKINKYYLEGDPITEGKSDNNHTTDEAIGYSEMIELSKFGIGSIFGQASKAFMSCTNGSIFYAIESIYHQRKYINTLRAAENDLMAVKASTNYEQQAYTIKIFEANTRINNLQMKNYIYYIGADSELQKQIIWDAVEDVIKCVQSATKYGTVPGCQLSIVKICSMLSNEYYPLSDDLDNDTALTLLIYNIISLAVLDVYAQVIHGPDGTGILKTLPNWAQVREMNSGNKEELIEAMDKLEREAADKLNDIFKQSIDSMNVFNIETLQFDKDIITSAETDMMVLRAASELVKILISGNQCIFLDTEISDDENVID